MTLKQLLAKFSNDTRIRVENIDSTLFEGYISESQSLEKSNLNVVWCEIHDNILIIQVEI